MPASVATRRSRASAAFTSSASECTFAIRASRSIAEYRSVDDSRRLAARDTEDFNFVPQDQRNYAADRGPSLNDARHRLVIAGDVALPLGFSLATVLTARSALPYNVTTGTDDNRDGSPTTDRPRGVSRNSGRGAALFQADVRIKKTFAFGVRRIELVAEAFNLTNRLNWTFPVNFVPGGGVAYPTPSGAELTRELQFGVRALF